MLQKILEEVGLNKNEANIYLACLKLGTQDLKALAKETNLSKTDTMMLLADLLDRGFISRFAHEKDFFTAEQPKVLLKILENKKYKLESSIRDFKKTLPKFEDYMNPAFTKPEMAYYEGRDGVVAAYEDTLTSKTDIHAIASLEDTETIFPKYVPQYYKRRKAAGILIKALFPDSAIARRRQKKDGEELRISRLVPNELMQFHIELNIYDDKVAYFSISEELAIIVKSKVIADSMRDMFNMCWKMSAAFEKKKRKK